MFFIHPSPTCPSISTILQITHIQLLNLTRSLADLFNPSALLPNSPFLSAALRSEMASPRIYLLWVNSNHHHQQTGVVDCRCTLCNPKSISLLRDTKAKCSWSTQTVDRVWPWFLPVLLFDKRSLSLGKNNIDPQLGFPFHMNPNLDLDDIFLTPLIRRWRSVKF